MMDKELKGVTEYREGLPVKIIETDSGIGNVGNGRLVVLAGNDDGYNGTEVDLDELIDWIKVNMPEKLI